MDEQCYRCEMKHNTVKRAKYGTEYCRLEAEPALLLFCTAPTTMKMKLLVIIMIYRKVFYFCSIKILRLWHIWPFTSVVLHQDLKAR